jgi:ATP-dependent DNA helicase RecG
MDSKQIKILIKAGESNSVEFKRCSTKLSSSVFESICAFLNRNGGHLFIGISDSKEVLGMNKITLKTTLKI